MKNLLENIKLHKLLYIVVFSVEFLACFLLCFFIGLLINNEYMVLDKNAYNLSVSIEFINEECRKTVGEIEPILSKSLNILDRKYDTVTYYSMGYYGEEANAVSKMIFNNFTYKNGIYYKGNQHTDYTDAQLSSGEIIDQNAYDMEEHVAISSHDTIDGYRIGDTFRLCGSDYKVVGIRGGMHNKSEDLIVLIIPVTAWDKIPVSGMKINLKCLMTKENKEQLEELFYASFGKDNIIIDDYAAENADLQAAYKSVFIISVMVMFATLGILSMLHTYLFIHQRKRIAISRICGCSRKRCIFDFVKEKTIMAVISTGVGGSLFLAVETMFLVDNYPYMIDIYSPMMIIIVCFGVVALCVIQSICMALINVKKDVKEMLL